MKNKLNIILTVLIIIIAGGGGWLTAKYFMSPSGETVDAPREQPLVQTGTMPKDREFQAGKGEDNVSVRIYYPSIPSKEGTSEGGVSFDEVKLKSDPVPVKRAETLMAEYLKRLGGGLKDTKLLGVYRDRENILYIDLSDEFRRDLTADAGQEYIILKSLFRTVVTNVQGTSDIKLLIEGKEAESIGGHFYTLYPLKDSVLTDSPGTGTQSGQ